VALSGNAICSEAIKARPPNVGSSPKSGHTASLRVHGAAERYGHRFSADQKLVPPFFAVKVTGALFDTQGGLVIDTTGRVKRKDGSLFPNLFSAGGAAVGISGTTAAGYLSGNGLLTATVLGRLAGQSAAGRRSRNRVVESPHHPAFIELGVSARQPNLLLRLPLARQGLKRTASRPALRRWP
jgi:succinate dehydrogenase/fumarate reductase flavoprotein subunit